MYDDLTTSVQTDKVDVYMLGNVLYYLHTNQWLYEGIPNKQAMEMIYRGETSSMVQQKPDGSSPVVALRNAIEMCWARDWQLRPSARHVSDYLMNKLREHDKTLDEEGAVIVVRIPPLGKNHRFTDSDFNRNFVV